MFTITDNITGQAVTVEYFDIAESITPWYPEAPVEITEAIAALETAVTRGESTHELEALLDVTVRAL